MANNAFKPKPLRSTKHMADTACHVLGSTTQLGLTQVLGAAGDIMRFAFWKKPDPSKLDTFSWNLMVAAIDPDQCWKIASLFRDTGMPGSVRNCETSFLMGSIVRDIIRSTVPEKNQQSCVTSAESAYFKTFDDQSSEPLPPEMANIYGALTLGHVSRIALASYGEDHDSLFLTSAKLVQRLKGDPRMKYEIMPLFEERASFLRGLYAKAIAS